MVTDLPPLKATLKALGLPKSLVGEDCSLEEMTERLGRIRGGSVVLVIADTATELSRLEPDEVDMLAKSCALQVINRYVAQGCREVSTDSVQMVALVAMMVTEVGYHVGALASLCESWEEK